MNTRASRISIVVRRAIPFSIALTAACTSSAGRRDVRNHAREASEDRLLDDLPERFAVLGVGEETERDLESAFVRAPAAVRLAVAIATERGLQEHRRVDAR